MVRTAIWRNLALVFVLLWISPLAGADAGAPVAAGSSVAGDTLDNDHSYINSSGHRVHSPAHTASGRPPPDATAECRDHTFSFSEHHRGTCSRHGGVLRWLD
jgi:hypothetical protein